MLDGNSAPAHPILTFWLDVADKAIKFAAVALGGLWTYWNYRKSRTYSKKLELQIADTVFAKGDLYVDIIVTRKNVGFKTRPRARQKFLHYRRSPR